MASLGGGYLACIDADGLDVGTRHQDAGVRDATSPYVPPDSDGAVMEPGDAGRAACDAGTLTSTDDDPLNCGTCGNVCPAPSALLEGVAACVGGKCTTVCATGHADCNGVASDGCEIATATDANNCGACMHDCGGGACTQGMCGSVAVTSVGDAGTEVVELAVDDAGVYFVTDSPPSLWRAEKSGGAATLLATGTELFGLALVGSSIFYADTGSGTLNTVLTDGGGGDMIALAPGIRGLATAGSTVAAAVVAQGSTSAHVALLSGRSFGNLYTQSDTPYHLAANASTVYSMTQSWLAAEPDAGIPTDGSVYRCAFPCSAATPIATSQSRPFAVSVDATNVYWSTFGTREHDGTVSSCPLAGCPASGPRVIASGLTTPEHLASDGTTVYWADPTDGVVRSIGLGTASPGDGGAATRPMVLATGTHPEQLAIDDSYVYWSDTGGRVLRVRR